MKEAESIAQSLITDGMLYEEKVAVLSDVLKRLAPGEEFPDGRKLPITFLAWWITMQFNERKQDDTRRLGSNAPRDDSRGVQEIQAEPSPEVSG